jgi:hypothetical protein
VLTSAPLPLPRPSFSLYASITRSTDLALVKVYGYVLESNKNCISAHPEAIKFMSTICSPPPSPSAGDKRKREGADGGTGAAGGRA